LLAAGERGGLAVEHLRDTQRLRGLAHAPFLLRFVQLRLPVQAELHVF
jgi:hypothetical protein